MFILKYLNIYLVQNKGAAAARLMGIFLAKRGKWMYAFTVSPYLIETHSKSKKEEDIKSPQPKVAK